MFVLTNPNDNELTISEKDDANDFLIEINKNKENKSKFFDYITAFEHLFVH